MEVNLISDTVTVPSEGMLKAMVEAKVGDDVFKQDPTVIQLEETVADMFGMDCAMFFPSGTMSNQTAVRLHTNSGEQLICDENTHIYNYEAGGASANSGVSCRLIQGDRGRINARQVQENINPKAFYHMPRTKLVCVENTSNKAGGSCYDFENLMDIYKVCQNNGLKYHLDGARLWNAMIETSASPKDYGKLFDTISLCFSKGLGCPVGSVLLFDKKDFEEVRRIRTLLGGNMRQSGYLAACALYALENHLDSLKDDHIKAKEIESVLDELVIVHQVQPVETNIIIFSLCKSIDQNLLIDELNKKGIKILDLGQDKIRLVTHRDYNDHQHEYFLSTLKEIDISYKGKVIT